jgi:predicted HAD superfamily Cof-like phosphohydrolase
MSKHFAKDMKSFVKKFKFDQGEFDQGKKDFRQSLLLEEWTETERAIIDRDAEEVVDGCIDMMVVALGTLTIAKVDVIELWKNIDRKFTSNMVNDVKSATWITTSPLIPSDACLSSVFCKVSYELQIAQTSNMTRSDGAYYDDLIDVVFECIKFLLRCDINIGKAWNAVHKANMSKQLGIKPGREASGGWDVIKPDGWVAPSHKNNHGDLVGIFL